jgi:hypothetical protein
MKTDSTTKGFEAFPNELIIFFQRLMKNSFIKINAINLI